MKIYKPSYTRPTTGEPYTSPKWSVQFYVRGRLYRRALGTADRRLAEELAHAMVRREERRAAGLLDPAEEHRDAPFAQHVEAFVKTLVARGASDVHLAQRKAALLEFVRDAGVRTLADLDEKRATAWVSSKRSAGLAAASINSRIRSLRQFVRWAISTRRLSWDPIPSMRLLNEKIDRRHVRRALTHDELARLLDAARRRPLAEKTKERVIVGVSREQRARLVALGEVRALVYAVAAGTGLRRGELSRLRWGDVDLDGGSVHVRAESSKSRRDQSVPLRSDLVDALAAHRPHGAGPKDAVFDPAEFPTLRTFKKDAVAAGLGTMVRGKGAARGCETFDLTDASGRTLDFHCLRVTFVSHLVAAGVHPRVAQALARHAKLETTMAIYCDVTSLDLRGAVESMGAARAAAPALRAVGE